MKEMTEGNKRLSALRKMGYVTDTVMGGIAYCYNASNSIQLKYDIENNAILSVKALPSRSSYNGHDLADIAKEMADTEQKLLDSGFLCVKDFGLTPHLFATEKEIKEMVKDFNNIYEMAEEDIANGYTTCAAEDIFNLEYIYGKLCEINGQTDRENAMECDITGRYRTLLLGSANTKHVIGKEMDKPGTDDDGRMLDSEALRIAIDYISKRISELMKRMWELSELTEASKANCQDDTTHDKIVDELWTLMQVRTALENMEIDKEDEENN